MINYTSFGSTSEEHKLQIRRKEIYWLQKFHLILLVVGG